MKLLFAIKHLADSSGGAERVLCTVASTLAERGHEVSIVTFDPPAGQPFYRINPRVRLVNCDIGDAAHSARTGETLRRITVLRRLAAAERPDAAVGFMHSVYVPLALALAGTGVPVVASEHTVPEHFRVRPAQYAMILAIAPLIRHCTVLSEAIRARYPVPLRWKMLAMPNPSEEPNGVANSPGEKPRYRILSVGRLAPEKNQVALIDAFARLASLHPEWDLRIVGKGALEAKLSERIQALGLAGRVSLPGNTPDIAGEYCSADILSVPSRYESQGLVTAEAMSYGLPVVGFADCPGTNDLVEDGVTGLLAPGIADRAASLADALSRLMSDPALRVRMGAAGRAAFTRRRHPVGEVVDRWETLLAGVKFRP